MLPDCLLTYIMEKVKNMPNGLPTPGNYYNMDTGDSIATWKRSLNAFYGLPSKLAITDEWSEHEHEKLKELISMYKYGTQSNKPKKPRVPENLRVNKVIFNGPATIVLWHDGTKTVVTHTDDTPYDKEKALAMCFAKKALGNNYEYYSHIKKWLK